MRKDSIIRQVRKIKDENAAKYGYDVRALGKAIQKEQRQSGRKSSPPRQKRAKVK